MSSDPVLSLVWWCGGVKRTPSGVVGVTVPAWGWSVVAAEAFVGSSSRRDILEQAEDKVEESEEELEKRDRLRSWHTREERLRLKRPPPPPFVPLVPPRDSDLIRAV